MCHTLTQTLNIKCVFWNKPTFDSEEVDKLKPTLDVAQYSSLSLKFALPLTLADANEDYFMWCLSSWSLKAEGYLNLLLTLSQ